MSYTKFFKKQTTILVIAVIGIVLSTLGLTYAVFMQVDTNTDNQVVETGSLIVTYNKGTTLTAQMLPMSNANGLAQTGYSFAVQNTGTLPAEYVIKIHNNTDAGVLNQNNYLAHNQLYISLDGGTPKLISALTKEDPAVVIENNIIYIMYEGLVGTSKTNNHNVKLWIKEDADESIIGKGINLILEVEAVVQENGKLPIDLVAGMIPVSYNTSGQTVKASQNNSNNNWYNYSEFKWANMVLVKGEGNQTRTYYESATIGTVIDEADILAYYVWIPRYRYKIFNNSSSGVPNQTIEVEFENKTTTKSLGTLTGSWLTHPAFTFDETELNGIWVGKFELSADEATTCYTTSNTANCDKKDGTIMPRVKPNKNSWRFTTISTFFTISQYFQSNSMYGISSSTMDSHMIKNMEWGAIAYLSHSQFGKKGNQGTEVWSNNYNAGYGSHYNNLTGCSGTSASGLETTSCAYQYPHANGVESSTSGTIYGLYDMAGGSYEYVMGNMAANGQSVPGPINVGVSGFNGTSVPYPAAKYYDSYLYGTTTSDITAFLRGKLGDATRETLTCTNTNNCGWYGDGSYFPYNTNVWFIRGGDWASTAVAGVFNFNYYGGNESFYLSSRSVLTVE